MWGVGSRLQWDVTKSFYIGVEGLYENMNESPRVNPATVVVGHVLAGGYHVSVVLRLRGVHRTERQQLDDQRPHAQGLPALIV